MLFIGIFMSALSLYFIYSGAKGGDQIKFSVGLAFLLCAIVAIFMSVHAMQIINAYYEV